MRQGSAFARRFIERRESASRFPQQGFPTRVVGVGCAGLAPPPLHGPLALFRAALHPRMHTHPATTGAWGLLQQPAPVAQHQRQGAEGAVRRRRRIDRAQGEDPGGLRSERGGATTRLQSA